MSPRPRPRRFLQVDVFCDQPAKGNGLAVVVDADGLSTQQMQDFAAWTNLAETTFLLPPEDPAADYRVRIFTPAKEMRFAGHPTLGSAISWLHCGGVPRDAGRLMQECDIGLVEVDLSAKHPAFVAPPTEIIPMPEAERDRLIAAMQIDPAWVKNTICLNNGPAWNLFELHDAGQVLAVNASLTHSPDHAGLSLIGAHPTNAPCAYEVRNIAPSSGMVEDPITGSLNAAIAHWLAATDRLPDQMTVAQGTAINRPGRVSYRKRGDEVLIGGAVNVLIDGQVTL
ncbi:PhzF family phenazine biosynthesis protein [Thalassovita mediterranea]|jgi:PhzF family phenazine biosynthesis protein|uniref:Trans-2,3-dihydro-3-hydroxyanthranilate isomerase n=1 Tax=Thalassovita mediterranea TaxID=340021 RepID=A0A0N7M1B4_9RHOB|nr:PhzF family phenazine biosynthesis protein [Thalassovita mediterranea]CUH82835.1 Trans-2,3-dihydro-3-hydroxyanthranilate isomerase [Thalassovita mediterranea]SIS31541.1 phenazine biosynthesis protein PhzF family [Thalassovita mediterranea]